MMQWRASPNYNSRQGTPIDTLVLHYTGMETAQAAIERLCDPVAEVSAHYVVQENGKAYRMVNEDDRAWHAGVASWRGETNINSRSIGIELVNPGHEFGYREFPPEQIATLISLCHEILERHPIPDRNIVGHSDVAPARKQDPGELFPWSQLAARGIGVWPAANEDAPAVGSEEAPDLLAEIGYDIEDLDAAVIAFQRHFSPQSLAQGLDLRTLTQLARVHAIL